MKPQRPAKRVASRVAIAFAAVALAAPLIASGSQRIVTVGRFADGGLGIECRSPALAGRLPVDVYLPAGYHESSSRYPVVYFLHGLPAGPGEYQTYGFVASSVAASGYKAIVVSVQGARDENSDREYLDWSRREDWPAAIADDLTSCIDGRFRTIPTRTGRALIGLSAGGFGAFNIGLRRLDRFAAVESWSGYFVATDPTGRVPLQLGTAAADRRARVPRGDSLRRRLERLPTFVGFYVGRQDETFLDDNIRLDRAFRAHHIQHPFAVYEGGHSRSLWSKWAPLWLGYALEHLDRST